jgi:hypothetical protein
MMMMLRSWRSECKTMLITKTTTIIKKRKIRKNTLKKNQKMMMRISQSTLALESKKRHRSTKRLLHL